MILFHSAGGVCSTDAHGDGKLMYIMANKISLSEN